MSDVGLGALVNSYFQEKHQKQQDQRQKAIDLANQHAQQVQSQLEQDRLALEKSNAAETKQRNWEKDTESTREALVGEMQRDQQLNTEAKTGEARLQAVLNTQDRERALQAENDTKVATGLAKLLQGDGYDAGKSMQAAMAFAHGDTAPYMALVGSGETPKTKAILAAQAEALELAKKRSGLIDITTQEGKARLAEEELKTTVEKLMAPKKALLADLKNRGQEIENELNLVRTDQVKAQTNAIKARSLIAAQMSSLAHQRFELDVTKFNYNVEKNGQKQAETDFTTASKALKDNNKALADVEERQVINDGVLSVYEDTDHKLNDKAPSDPAALADIMKRRADRAWLNNQHSLLDRQHTEFEFRAAKAGQFRAANIDPKAGNPDDNARTLAAANERLKAAQAAFDKLPVAFPDINPAAPKTIGDAAKKLAPYYHMGDKGTSIKPAPAGSKAPKEVPPSPAEIKANKGKKGHIISRPDGSYYIQPS